MRNIESPFRIITRINFRNSWIKTLWVKVIDSIIPEYFNFALPELIGWYIGVLLIHVTIPTKEYAHHQGIITIMREFYPEIKKVVKKISSEMYQIVTNE